MVRKTMKFSFAVTVTFLFIALAFGVRCSSTRTRCETMRPVNIRFTADGVGVVDPAQRLIFVKRGECVRLNAPDAPRGSRLRIRRLSLSASSDESTSNTANSAAASSTGTVASTDTTSTSAAADIDAQTKTDTCVLDSADGCVIESDATLLVACLSRGGTPVDVDDDGSDECAPYAINIVLECGPQCEDRIRVLYRDYEAAIGNCQRTPCRYELQVNLARQIEAARKSR